MSSDIRIALLGYGRMGKELNAIILERGWPDPVLIDPQDPVAHSSPQTAPLDAVDVCIDFTEPSEAHSAIMYMLNSGIPVVSGTTGWQTGADSVREAVQANNTAFLHANNFSIGVYLFASIVQKAASLLGAFPRYDIALHETHHRLKKDIPSGTATLLAQRILDAHPGKTRSGPLEIGASIAPDMLTVSASRVGTVFGTHSVLIDSDTDTMELKHTAKGRLGFAEGALAAAEWIIGKEGYFTLEDMIHDITST